MTKRQSRLIALLMIVFAIGLICYVASATLLVAFGIKLLRDTYVYNTTLNSAPFSIGGVVDMIYFIVPAIILLVIGKVVQKKQIEIQHYEKIHINYLGKYMRIVTYMETYPTKISDVINVKVVKEAETSDLIKMDETEIACILDKNEFWENNTEN